MSPRVTTSDVEPDIVVLHLSGSMTTGPETDALESLFHELLDRRTTKLAFDLTGIDEIDSGGTLFIVRCFFAARSAGGELRFAAVRPEVFRPFKNAMLDTLLPFDPTVSAACEHFSSGAKSGGSPVWSLLSWEWTLLQRQPRPLKPPRIGSHKTCYIHPIPDRSAVMSLRATTSKVEPDIVVLRFSGTMTIGPETHALEWLLRCLLCRGETKLIFDLADVDRIDADAALFLVLFFFTVRGCGGELRFAGASADLVRPFQGTMLDTVFLFDPTSLAMIKKLLSGGGARLRRVGRAGGWSAIWQR